MIISYAICSANHLPFAKSLADSLLSFNPTHTFVIILADRQPGIDRNLFSPHTIITADELLIQDLEKMNERYDIFELCCALKPFAADYLFKTYPACRLVFYFDTDILVFNNLSEAEFILADHPVLITPHIMSSADFEDRIDVEIGLLRSGIFNGGFFGLKRCDDTDHFLAWWMKRLKDHCFNDAVNGLFVDQLWLNFLPTVSRNAVILYNPGYNMAYWNFGERLISEKDGKFFVNEIYPLVFFHFSGHNPDNESVLSKYHSVYNFDNRPDSKAVFAAYRNVAIRNNRDDFFSLTPQLGKLKEQPVPEEIIELPPPPPPREKNFFKRKYKKWFGGK
ncbi:MAG: hypothetical protein WKF88_05865 [Ferruginibacter sp.]